MAATRTGPLNRRHAPQASPAAIIATAGLACSPWIAAAWPSSEIAGNAGIPHSHAKPTWPISWTSEARNQPMNPSSGVSANTGAVSAPSVR
jgi:hypothetical protein